MVRLRLLFLLGVMLACAANVEAVLLTHYGSTEDSSGDPASLAGIGNHNNILTAYQNPSTPASAAITQSYADANGLSVGQSFTTTANGVTYNLVYADTVPATYNGQDLGSRIDIYDPNNVLGSANGFSAGVTSINGGPVGADVGGATNATVQNINIAVVASCLVDFRQQEKHGWVP
jgi:hypothetical protein